MNKKGFTLVEMLAVITILALVSTIAASSAVSITRQSKENLYCTKLSLIKSMAREYAINYEKELNNSTDYFDGNKSIRIKVSDLIKSGKISPDKGESVLSPLDNSVLDDLEIILYLKNNQINAYIPESNIC